MSGSGFTALLACKGVCCDEIAVANNVTSREGAEDVADSVGFHFENGKVYCDDCYQDMHLEPEESGHAYSQKEADRLNKVSNY